MPFVKMDIKAELEKQKSQDPEFAQACTYIEKENKLIKKAKAIRVRRKISQEYLAEKMGFSQQAISRMEKLSVNPTLRNFIKYLDGIDCRLVVVPKIVALRKNNIKTTTYQNLKSKHSNRIPVLKKEK